MKTIIIFLLCLNTLFSYTVDKENEDKFVTHKELAQILHNLFPEKVKLKITDLDRQNKLYNIVLPNQSYEVIVRNLQKKMFNEKDIDVNIYCDYLLEKEIEKFSSFKSLYLKTLDICSNYNIKFLNYDEAINQVYLMIEENNGDYNNKALLERLLELYTRKKDKDNIKKIKNILLN